MFQKQARNVQTPGAAGCRLEGGAPALLVWAIFLLLGASIAFGEPLQHPSLKGAVSIRRDGRGIPYIKAANEHDLFFAQGYATAADRLFQMELLRRTVRGELAEVFGKEFLEADKRRRIYG